MAFTKSRNRIFSLFLASSISGMGNLACPAADRGTKALLPLWQEQAAQIAAKAAPAPGTAGDTDTLAMAEAPIITVGATNDASSDGIIDQVLASDEAMDDSDNKSILKSPLLIASAQPLPEAAPPADSMVLSGGASMTPDEACAKIDSLTRDILLKEIELERFNLNYTRQVAVQGRWKGWRYTGLQEVNGAMGLAGAIISVAYRGARLEEAQHIKPCIQESANYIPMIGTYIGAGAAGLEFGINGIHDMIARHRGYGPAESLRKVAALKGQIDKLLAERESLTQMESSSPTLSGQVELDRAENKVMGDMLDQSLQEFERFHVGARRTIAFQQMQYFLDFAKYTINGLGYQFAFLSLHDHHRRYNGNAGTLWMTAGGIYMGAPIVSRMFGKSWAELTRYSSERALGHSWKAGVSNLEADVAHLDQLAKQTRISTPAQRNAERATDRFAHYEDHQKTYTNEIRAAEKAKNQSVLTATENVGAALYVGGSKLAFGICFAIPGFNHIYNAGSGSIEADRVTNDDLFVASLIAIPATAFSMLDSLRIQVKGEITRHKLAAKGELSGQVVTKRLAQLDEMEKKLKSSVM